jgi:hypothetical protein
MSPLSAEPEPEPAGRLACPGGVAGAALVPVLLVAVSAEPVSAESVPVSVGESDWPDEVAELGDPAPFWAGGAACATPARGSSINQAPASSSTTNRTRRRRDHLATAYLLLNQRHPSKPVVSGASLAPDDRTRLQPTNNSLLIALHRCEVDRLEHPVCPP